MQRPFNFLFLLLILQLPGHLFAQDTIKIDEVRVTSWLVKQSLQRTTTAASIIDSSNLRLQTFNSLVPALNAVPGVRMEERSPGSYRLSLRGSLLRSPFGVRNVKIYFNEYPLTDAGGNTYINILPSNAINDIEILKGPDGSLFGANSGGVITIHSNDDQDKLKATVAAGSYRSFKQNIGWTKNAGAHTLNIAESYQGCDGYRDNSRLQRFYLHAADQWKYSKYSSLKALLFYGDIFYQTPGGLNKAQFDSAPAQARQATATLRSAEDQKAAVYNKMLFGGLTHIIQLTDAVQYLVSVFASSVNFKNPFITNFEVRKEKSYGGRTFLSYSKSTLSKIDWEYNIGLEWQQTRSNISNYRNNFGEKGNLTSAGNITSDQHFIFNKLKADIRKTILIEAGLSLNYYSYRFKDSLQLNNKFNPKWMPRIALSYTPVKKITLRSSVSKGYSVPTTAEVRPSNNNVYRDLQAETGINTEIGLRYNAFSNRLLIDAAAYTYRLKNAIVQQDDILGNAYFVNAGGTVQKGIELQLSYQFISAKHMYFKKIQLVNSSTINNFKFKQYVFGQNNFSGKNVTGVPKYVFVNSLLLETRLGAFLFLQYNHTSNIPLNDGNVFFAKAYDLLQMKIGRRFRAGKCQLEIYAGADNILNEHYSLGNDLNATGSRFYNAAPLRNYFAGLTFTK
ncbi:MAG: TonB-dependent receptor [Ferruginibacter sp.]